MKRVQIGDNPPLSEEEVNNLPMIDFSCSSDDMLSDEKTVQTADETKGSTESDQPDGALTVIASVITNCTGGKRSAHYCTSCSVCLDEFEPDESVRQLLPCNHLFHSECITPWLTQRSGNCPLVSFLDYLSTHVYTLLMFFCSVKLLYPQEQMMTRTKVIMQVLKPRVAFNGFSAGVGLIGTNPILPKHVMN